MRDFPMRLSIIAILVLSSCTSTHHNFVQQPPVNQEDCMNLFENINEIQEQRHVYMAKMDLTTRKFKAGKMSKKRFQKKREDWLTDEGQLRGAVTTLYNIGYEHRCF